MKLSFFTALLLSWLYGTVAGLLLPHGPLVLALYGLVLIGIAGAVHVTRQAIRYHLALAKFRQEFQMARWLAEQHFFAQH